MKVYFLLEVQVVRQLIVCLKEDITALVKGMKCFGFFQSVIKIVNPIHFCAENFAWVQLNLKDKIKQMSVLCSSVCTFVNAKKLNSL